MPYYKTPQQSTTQSVLSVDPDELRRQRAEEEKRRVYAEAGIPFPEDEQQRSLFVTRDRGGDLRGSSRGSILDIWGQGEEDELDPFYSADETDSRYRKEVRGIVGIFAGIPRGLVELGKLVLPGKKKGELSASAFGKSIVGSVKESAMTWGGTTVLNELLPDDVKKRISGSTTIGLRRLKERADKAGNYSSVILEDLGNMAAMAGGVAAAAGATSKTLSAAGKAGQAAKAAQLANDMRMAAAPLHTVLKEARQGISSKTVEALARSAEEGVEAGRMTKFLAGNRLGQRLLEKNVRDPLLGAQRKSIEAADAIDRNVREWVRQNPGVADDAVAMADEVRRTAATFGIDLPDDLSDALTPSKRGPRESVAPAAVGERIVTPARRGTDVDVSETTRPGDIVGDGGRAQVIQDQLFETGDDIVTPNLRDVELQTRILGSRPGALLRRGGKGNAVQPELFDPFAVPAGPVSRETGDIGVLATQLSSDIRRRGGQGVGRIIQSWVKRYPGDAADALSLMQATQETAGRLGFTIPNLETIEAATRQTAARVGKTVGLPGQRAASEQITETVRRPGDVIEPGVPALAAQPALFEVGDDVVLPSQRGPSEVLRSETRRPGDVVESGTETRALQQELFPESRSRPGDVITEGVPVKARQPALFEDSPSFQRIAERVAETIRNQARTKRGGREATKTDARVEAYVNLVKTHTARQAIPLVFDRLHAQGVLRTIAADAPTPSGWVDVDVPRFMGDVPIARKGLGIDAELTAALGGRTLPDVVRASQESGQRIIVPQGIAKQMERWEGSGKVAQLFQWGDTPLDIFRGAVLFHSPRWLVNNTVGNMTLAALEGALFSPRAWREAYQSFRTKFTDVPGSVASGLAQDSVLAGADSLIGRIATDNPVARTMKTINHVTDQFARTMVYHRNLKKFAKEAGDIDVDAMLAKVRNGGSLTPNELRLAEQAGEAARMAMVDYSNLTPFERNVIRRIVPFYSWQKGILKLTLALPADHPLKFALIEHIAKDFGGFSAEERETMPEFLLPSISLPGGGTLGTRGFNPFQDSLSLLRPDTILDQVNPLFESLTKFAAQKAAFQFGVQEVGPGGFPVPQVGLDDELLDQVGGLGFLGLGIRAGAKALNLGQGTPLGRPIDPQRDVLLQSGLNIRTPEQVIEMQQREQEARKQAQQSKINQRLFDARRRLGLTNSQNTQNQFNGTLLPPRRPNL